MLREAAFGAGEGIGKYFLSPLLPISFRSMSKVLKTPDRLD
ncbi:hypothetical protein BRPE64_ACDS07680 [Caballeronia insecticola]|uniref:Uncharacterized protein n=1 Tax=Caballeronia insecticola TaxID=758793 RepID=R4WX59_9BURK|nr:hypothetical protein BRPE64_ACDS07680 [Caballeronia insecticola]